jgi:hypothetical protein
LQCFVVTVRRSLARVASGRVDPGGASHGCVMNFAVILAETARSVSRLRRVILKETARSVGRLEGSLSRQGS